MILAKNGITAAVSSWKQDLVAGFLVFLIALPLCLGISLASGFPAVAGIFTAIVGGVLTPFISNSELTIKGPAAGLIVIVLGCVTDFGFTMGRDPAADYQAYRLALGVGVIAGVLQVLLGILRCGNLGEFFPVSTVHGMLSAIGVIIIAKQLPIALGTTAFGEPLELLLQIPSHFTNMNPEIAVIGAVSLLILFGLPFLRPRYLRLVPGPLLVVLVAVPLGLAFDLSHEHSYEVWGYHYNSGEKSLVSVPPHLIAAVTFPDLSGLATLTAWKWVIMYTLVASLESLLSARATDMIDPWKRKANLDRDLMSVGLGNIVSSLVGGLPMISEIVRSRANIDNGAKTRLSNFFHGLLLFLAAALASRLIHRIPLAALAAMLIYTGSRLAHPKEFVRALEIGFEQLILFSTTMIAVLATDPLIGVFVGVGLKSLIHLSQGVPLLAFFHRSFTVDPISEPSELLRARLRPAAIFAQWLPLRRFLEQRGIAEHRSIALDLSEAGLVDHTMMEHLHQISRDFERVGLKLVLEGLENHIGLSAHPLAARKRQRLTSRKRKYQRVEAT